MMQNLECDYCHGYGVGLVAGQRWAATPFVMNFGFPHGYDSDIFVCEMSKKGVDVFNTFADEPVRSVKANEVKFLDDSLGLWSHEFATNYFATNIAKYVRPRNYRYSRALYLLSEATRFDTTSYNYVHVLITKRGAGSMILIAASFVHNPNKQTAIQMDDMIPLFRQNDVLPMEPNKPMLITMCSDHFKYTAKMYRDPDCFIRLLTHPCKVEGLQYTERVRFDSGRTKSTGLYDRFSVVQTLKFNNDLAQSLEEKIPCLDF